MQDWRGSGLLKLVPDWLMCDGLCADTNGVHDAVIPCACIDEVVASHPAKRAVWDSVCAALAADGVAAKSTIETAGDFDADLRGTSAAADPDAPQPSAIGFSVIAGGGSSRFRVSGSCGEESHAA